MENLGQRITELRKKRNLTQSELGEKLNVTSQAVSKWENNLSEPDLETTKKLCEILEVSMSELLGLDDKSTTSDAPAEQPAPVIIEKIVEKPVETPPSKIILGYCKECNKAVSNGEYVVSSDGVGVICNECNKQLQKEADKQSIIDRKNNYQRYFIKGAIIGGSILIIGIILSVILINNLSSLPSGLIVLGTSYMLGSLLAEIMWGGSALHVLLFFSSMFKARFLNILLIIIFFGLVLLILLLGFFITLVYAALIFPASLIVSIIKLNKYNNEVLKLEIDEIIS